MSNQKAVLVALLILILGLTPSLFSIWVMRRVDTQAQERLRLALPSTTNRGLPNFHLAPDQHYVEGIGYIIGDITCQFNARSSYIRCAVNPIGPCQDCLHYRPQEWHC
ncbi:DUF6464 family protein [Oculatella sp. FACHB-28]|uniref:DUF6464 family protein n=1 Tax=Oculatella sp. FACHB-28 TaxID=2692845 RepID=UPI0018EFEF74|nr:DUF6464 family protein [Oculatella sp. FACHB-28]